MAQNSSMGSRMATPPYREVRALLAVKQNDRSICVAGIRTHGHKKRPTHRRFPGLPSAVWRLSFPFTAARQFRPPTGFPLHLISTAESEPRKLQHFSIQYHIMYFQQTIPLYLALVQQILAPKYNFFNFSEALPYNSSLLSAHSADKEKLRPVADQASNQQAQQADQQNRGGRLVRWYS